mmetsp:Transcript_21956/g.27692  ORF Transcript_21956/g.27692 Transcript_21956/m.27692 type:complete len:137 (-) Transcript_21956:225-635(-)
MTVYKGVEEAEVVETIILSEYETEEEMHGIFERLGFEKLPQEEVDEKVRNRALGNPKKYREKVVEPKNVNTEEIMKSMLQAEKKRYDELKNELTSSDGDNEEELRRLEERMNKVVADLEKRVSAAKSQANTAHSEL